MGVNSWAGSHLEREKRKYSARQSRCWPPLVQMMRVRVRRPRQMRVAKACRTARTYVRRWGKHSSQPATISRKQANRLRGLSGDGPPGRCPGTDEELVRVFMVVPRGRYTTAGASGGAGDIRRS